MLSKLALAALSAGVILASAVRPAPGHISVAPGDAPPGVVQRYSLLVPGEKSIPTTRIEVQFPDGLQVTEVEAVPGWRATTQKGREGRILSAVWEGGSIPPGQFVEFGLLARTPDASGPLTWKVIQTYRDRSEQHWIGSPGAEFPAPVTQIRQAGGTPSPDRLAPVALGVALAALLGAAVAFWRVARSHRR